MNWKEWKDRSLRFVRGHVLPFAVMALLLLGVRSSLADWNDVPTGSMNPTILEGDRIFVNKLAYDLKVPFTTWHLVEWGDPQRGEVVVFYAPADGSRMVKRVAAGPGDTIEMVNNRLIVNSQPARYGPPDPEVLADYPANRRGPHRFGTEAVGGESHPVMETPGLPGRRSFGPVTVPPGKYLLLGDNRDNSFDSRYWGLVDRDQIVGRATTVVLSLDPERSYRPRWGRTFNALP
jgi:signal peptidase I